MLFYKVTFKRRVWRAKNGGLPVEGVISNGTSAALSGWIICNVFQFLIDPF